jgi:hypothetical protein
VSVGDRLSPNVAIASIDAPARVSLSGRSAVRVVLHGDGVEGQVTTLALSAGALVIGTQSHTWSAGASRADVTFDLVPWTPGPLTLRAVAASTGPDAPGDNSVEVATYVETERVRVLALDAHPTWSSRFVTLALAQDPEVDLVSRTLLGRGITVRSEGYRDVTQSPADADAFDVVLVSSPDTESPQVLAWLDAFMRTRGGSVVVLADDLAGLAATRRWWPLAFRERSTAVPAAIGFERHPDRPWRAGVFADPVALPLEARVLASTREAGPRPVIVSQPVGIGRLVASLALDAWRYRGDDNDPFAHAFRSLVVGLGRETRRRLEIDVAAGMPRDDAATIRARSRPSTAPGANRLLPIARFDMAGVRVEGVLWPTAAEGVFQASVRPSGVRGATGVEAVLPGAEARAALQVDASGRTQPPPAPLPLGWLAAAHGGVDGRSADATALVEQVGKQLAAAGRSESVTIWPMRSPWWLVPFVAALGVEWVARRRAGLR